MIDLLKRLNSKNISIGLVNDQLDIKAPKGAMTEELLSEIRVNKTALIAFISKYRSDDESEITIPTAPDKSDYVLSSSQFRLWLIEQAKSNIGVYNMPSLFSVKGAINVKELEKAFSSLIERHEILRTNIIADKVNGIPKQVVRQIDTINFKLNYTDISKEEDKFTKLHKHIENEVEYNFDLESEALLRVSLVKMNKDDYVLSSVMHHIISDGWSSNIFISDIFFLYKSLSQNGINNLESLRIQYKDYAEWQQSSLNRSSLHTDKKYWLKQFKKEVPVLEMPTARLRPNIKSFRGKTIEKRIDKTVFENFRKLCRANSITTFIGFLSVVKILLYKYTNQTDLVIGSPFAGRELTELQNQIGFYVNTVGLRSSFKKEDTFKSLIDQIKQTTLEAYNHQNFPFDELIRSLELKVDRSRNPLFDVMLTVDSHNEIADRFTGVQELEIEEMALPDSTCKFDLEYVFREDADGAILYLTYNTDIYASEFIVQSTNHLEVIINSIIETPNESIEALNYLTKNEKTNLIVGFNNTNIDFGHVNKTFIDLFEDRVNKSPEKSAIKIENHSLNYRELDELSNQFAHFLIHNYHIDLEDIIGVKLERSDWLIVSLLAILKTGGAYLPIDLDYPKERISFIEADSNCSVIIDGSIISQFVNESDHIKSLPKIKIKSSNLAYVIYTSGSTGTPKGTLIEHRNLLNLCFWHIDQYGVDETSRGTMYSGIAFDASIWEMCPYLLAGASIYPISNQVVRLDLDQLITFLEESQISHCYLPTTICHELVSRDFESENLCVLTGGDTLKIKNQPKFKLFNNYGPTENTVVSTCFDLQDDFDSSVPIGRPISNTNTYVLDNNLDLVPIGVPGKLFVSGAGVARGYLNMAELTEERFIANPFVVGERMYDTGDIAKWLPDGNIEFLGRKDSQIKIRGYRIELGEIENTIVNLNKSIHQVSVIVRRDQLIAFYSGENIDTEVLEASLQQRIPHYMIPNHFVKLESLPLTPNGKIDKIYLEKVSISETKTKTIIPARNATEKALVVIWEELLGIKNISIKDDFFILGGHSLKLMKLMAKYQEVFKVSLSLTSLYKNTQLDTHADLLVQEKEQTIVIPRLPLQSNYAVSATQLRYWLIDKVKGKSKEFNITNTFNLPENTDRTFLEKALTKLIGRHETLRTTFIEVAGVPKQKIQKECDYKLTYIASKIEAKSYTNDHIFDLSIYPLFKIVVTDKQLYFNIHHSICDGWSVQVLYRDLLTLYQAEKEQKEAKLSALSIQYKEYSSWQNGRENTEVYQYHKTYWKKQLQQPLAYLQLPTDYSKKIKTTASAYSIAIRTELQEKIIALTKNEGVSLFALFMASFKILLYKLTYEKDSIVGIPVANRNHFQVNDLVGCFLNTLMLRDNIDEKYSFQTWLQKVNLTLTEGLIHQSYPFEKILEDSQILQTDRFPISPVFLNMVDFNSTNEALTSFDAHSEVLSVPPKFDMEYYIKSYTNGFKIECVYDNQQFSAETITLWVNTYVDILSQVTDDITKSISAISAFDSRGSIEQEFPKNDFEVYEDEEIQQTIVARFEKQVDSYSDNIAVVAGDKKLTYKTINNCANQLAQEINNQTRQSKRIGLLVSHTEASVIGMLGVLKSGHSYVPIDLENPIQRIEFILNDSSCNILVYEESAEDKALLLQRNNQALILIKLDKTDELLTMPNPVITMKQEDEAYVLYTSGSTGNPKGVIQTQKNVLHYIRVYTNNIKISNADNLSLFSRYSFDASVKDIYGAILNGATVSFYNIPKKGLTNLADWIRNEQISIVHMVPTIYRYFMSSLHGNEILETVRLLDLGGEASYKSDFELFKKHFPKYAFLVNDYGPTEATIVSQHFLTHKSVVNKNDLHLGSSVLETELSIVDDLGNEVKTYQEGEIMFTSKYLSLGYLNLEEKTQKVFIQEKDNSEKRSYRSGDLGRRLPNGIIEFLGRKDSQVKINGLRIELSEIEYHVAQIDNVSKAVIMLQEIEENRYITCYYIGKEIDENIFKTDLKERLPSYMIPVIYIRVSKFPLTRTGKIDRKALPIPQQSDLKNAKYKSPESDIEKELVEIWSTLLNVDYKSLGVLDNFFEIGGNSLQAVIIINTINKKYDTALSIENLYETLTIKELSEVLNFSVLQKQQNNDSLEEVDEIIL